ncbi:hypothetical protein [Streptacidiphilus sp. P02-A3a]|uniref:hypothetical protein n=1 Tax=Streptacidiphilus sp. P02-A3a TaxID=2704468 RepID=UPI0015FBD79D|nr:hypothetical protein [Streptacidiphilus sp. P02-A3a]QMU73344.1 hypothetical protein GXP74_39085 [Streptacidiphilus sp. P02-A3a]
MSDAIPVLLVLCLAAVFTLVPLRGPRRARRRCRETARDLRGDFRFRPIPRARPLPELSSLPPFHYGRDRRTLDQVAGAFAGLPGEVFSYTCRENGTPQWYQVAVLRLGRALPPIEVQHEPVFTSARVRYAPVDPRRDTGVPEFDSGYRASSPDERLARTLITPGLARTLLAAPEPCDWRVEGGLLVVWRRDGWSSGAALVGCCLAAVHALAPVLDLDPDQFGAPRSNPGPENG